jgi:hypothetical protein
MLNRRVLGLIIVVLVMCALAAVFLAGSLLSLPVKVPHELDFTVSGRNDCLRFLNSTVSTVYVPVTTDANEKWQLTINATQMAGGANGWTDVYIYKGYWDKGTDYKCLSAEVYPILSDISSADAQVTGNSPYTETFGGSAAESYTVFFIFPPGGQSTFHITLKKV